MVISLDILPFCLCCFHLVFHIILDQFFVYKHIYVLSFTHSRPLCLEILPMIPEDDCYNKTCQMFNKPLMKTVPHWFCHLILAYMMIML